MFLTKTLVPIEQRRNSVEKKYETTSKSLLTQTKLTSSQILKDSKEIDLNNTESSQIPNDTTKGLKRKVSELKPSSSNNNKYVDVKRLVRTSKAAPVLKKQAYDSLSLFGILVPFSLFF